MCERFLCTELDEGTPMGGDASIDAWTSKSRSTRSWCLCSRAEFRVSVGSIICDLSRALLGAASSLLGFWGDLLQRKIAVVMNTTRISQSISPWKKDATTSTTTSSSIEPSSRRQPFHKPAIVVGPHLSFLIYQGIQSGFDAVVAKLHLLIAK